MYAVTLAYMFDDSQFDLVRDLLPFVLKKKKVVEVKKRNRGMQLFIVCMNAGAIKP